ncbi:ROK family transcriptional regulator [Demequina sp. NBRC 110052]|uniref:ROK family transcriptional regulator n=1 Tax=Demequina sp. NBRC 110052 TaxID=1570341 RepID=UPI000A0568AD|nr:ROK family protein [Demequina sp. NBRC 110052]
MASKVSWPTGPGVLLDTIRSGGSWTRGQLLDELGWSRSTLGKRLEDLTATGLICRVGQQDSTGGRPADAIALDRSAGVVLGIDIGVSHSRLAIADLGGEILAEDEADVLVGAGPDEVFDWAIQCFDFMLDQLGRTRADVLAIGIGVPDSADPDTGTVVNPVMMPNWEGTVVSDMVRPAYPEAVVAVERDVSIMAMAEQRASWPTASNLMLAKITSNLGCGFIIGGQIYSGMHGGAGQLGQLRLGGRADAPRLGDVAAGWPIQRDLVLRGERVRTTADIVALARRGDEMTIARLREAALAVAPSLIDAAILFGPSVLVLAGTLVEAEAEVVEPIVELFREREADFVGGLPTLAVTTLGRRAGVVGAVVVGLNAMFEPDRADRLVARRLKVATMREEIADPTLA